MRSFVQEGDTLSYTAPTGGVTVGDVVTVRSGTGGQIGIVIDTALAGEVTPLAMRGVYELAAESGTGKTFAIGDILYWNTSTKKLTKTSTGNVRAGVCWLAKLAATTVGRVSWMSPCTTAESSMRLFVVWGSAPESFDSLPLPGCLRM